MIAPDVSGIALIGDHLRGGHYDYVVIGAARVLSIADIDAPKHGAQVTTSQVAHPEIALAEVARIYEEGAFDMRIDGRFPLDRIAEAQAINQTGRVAGKLVITLP